MGKLSLQRRVVVYFCTYRLINVKGRNMIVGLILIGSVIGAVSAVAAMVLGHPFWLALLIYSGVGVLSVLAGATVMVVRGKSENQSELTKAYSVPNPERG
ncbi:hypothetical protein ACROSR_14030 [Roseovarius tibetensis]|uniref:hypothetical protein n=1 Tax=Roseovarius tibetensis TaxID=2685897 RepID=UPI003D7F89C2